MTKKSDELLEKIYNLLRENKEQKARDKPLERKREDRKVAVYSFITTGLAIVILSISINKPILSWIGLELQFLLCIIQLN